MSLIMFINNYMYNVYLNKQKNKEIKKETKNLIENKMKIENWPFDDPLEKKTAKIPTGFEALLPHFQIRKSFLSDFFQSQIEIELNWNTCSSLTKTIKDVPNNNDDKMFMKKMYFLIRVERKYVDQLWWRLTGECPLVGKNYFFSEKCFSRVRYALLCCDPLWRGREPVLLNLTPLSTFHFISKKKTENEDAPLVLVPLVGGGKKTRGRKIFFSAALVVSVSVLQFLTKTRSTLSAAAALQVSKKIRFWFFNFQMERSAAFESLKWRARTFFRFRF